MFHIRYVHLHVFKRTCLLVFITVFFYTTMHVAGFLFTLLKSHLFSLRG